MAKVEELKRAYWTMRERLPEVLAYYSYANSRKRAILRWAAYRRRMVELSGVKVRLGPHLSMPILQAIQSGTYEKPEADIVTAKLRDDDVVMELGTGIGFLATVCAKRVGSDRVYTYEANPFLESAIRDTFALNSVSPTLQMCLLSVGSATASFYVSKDFWSSSGIRHDPRDTLVEVPMRDVNREIHSVQPTFLIVDIEGGEYELCRQIDWSGVRRLVMEIHPQVIGHNKAGQVRRAISSAGFEFCPQISTDEHLYYERS